jgi:hypothetical protein
MSESGVSKVVPINAPRVASAVGADLLNKVRELGIRRCGALLRTALDQVDDALFGISEKSDGGTDRSPFFNAMRDLRLKRPRFERAFADRVADGFAQFARGRGAPIATKIEAVDSGGLSLVDDRELEESLAIDGMAAKAATRYNSVLYALNQRLAAIVGAREVADEGNPLGPQALCAALQAGMRELEADVAVRLVILKLFDRHVVGELDAVYSESNTILADAGILPHIKYTLPKREHAPKPEAKPAEEAAKPAGSVASAAQVDEVLTAFAGLLAARRRAARGGVDLPPAKGPPLKDTDLLGALALMQTEAAQMEQIAYDPAALLEAVERVKLDLIDQLYRLGITDPDRRVTSTDEDAIDLVSLVFQFVVQDRNLPFEIQALLGRLQIPYVRVAIRDKHLFAQKEHPARRLLNAMAEASVSWSRTADHDGRYLALLQDIVDRIVREYHDDFSLFEELLAEFERAVAQAQRRAEIAEQRAAEAAQGRERLAQARKAAQQAVSARVDGREMPSLVREILTKPWTNFLVLTHLRQGASSREWTSAVNLVDALVWSVAPKTTPAETARLHGLIPQMQAYLRRGLSVVGFHESDAERLINGLTALLFAMHQRHPAPSQPAVEAAEAAVHAAAARQAHATAPTTEEPDEMLGAEPLPDDDEYLIKARNMKLGTWLEFSGSLGECERAKLSWISPISARLLFVNRKGLMVAERNLFLLARELRDGRARILEVAPIFDRALDGIMSRLRDDYAAAATTQAQSA